ncbi:MAG: 50S ribosomal protein L2 [Candidatus Aminicenantes bacterium]|nr:MAG: 50S ribosomal protein L2 [Candidatus Aminicenantes bacterium]
MGKRIMVRRRGRGAGVFKAPTHRRVAPVSYPLQAESESIVKGMVKDIVHDPGRGMPLALLKFESGKECYLAAPEGLSVNKNISIGKASPIEIGNILPIGKIPPGNLIFNIESRPGDGGKIARSSGSYAIIVAHTPRGTEIKLPSKKSVYLDERCRATIGVAAGAGRVEKPFLKAGRKAKLMKARGRKWPVVKGTSMIAASHPYGGGRHKHAGKPTTISKDAPPGRKVGLIAARQSVRSKRRKT